MSLEHWLIIYFKKIFTEKEKKVINILIIFFHFFIKVVSKLSQNGLLTIALKPVVSITHKTIIEDLTHF